MNSAALSALVLIWGLSSSSAFASDSADLAAGIKCKSAKDLVKVISKMSSMKPEQTDTVAAFPKMKIIPVDGRALPQRLFIRTAVNEQSLPIALDGQISGLDVLSGLDTNSDLCVEDKTLIGVTEGEKSIGLNLDFDVSYKNNSGSHRIEELRDGLDDGRAHIKKLVPAPVRMLIPKFDHVLIEYLDESGESMDREPQITALVGDVEVSGLTVERLENMHFINIDQLEEIGADRLRIAGGNYKMDPSPSLEKIRKLTQDD